jgi:DNA-directed RNA polymerase specialized sigma24 family protein
MLAQLKSASADKRIPDRLLSPLEDAEDLATLNPEQAYIDKESYESFKKSIFSSLSQLEYKVLCAFLSGESYSEIAVRLGITVKGVDNSLRRIRNKIKK